MFFFRTYGSTLISVHNMAENLTAHVFGPLVPVSTENGYTTIEVSSYYILAIFKNCATKWQV